MLQSSFYQIFYFSKNFDIVKYMKTPQGHSVAKRIVKARRAKPASTSVFGGLLRSYRKRLGIRLQPLAADTGINIASLSLMERGRLRPPEITPWVLRLAARLRLEPGSQEYDGFLRAASSERWPAKGYPVSLEALSAAEAERQFAAESLWVNAWGQAASQSQTTEPQPYRTPSDPKGSAELNFPSTTAPPPDADSTTGFLDARVLEAISKAIAQIAVSGAESITVTTMHGVEFVFPVMPVKRKCKPTSPRRRVSA